MNNTLLHDPRPSSLNACVDEDGQFDPVKFCAYTARMGEESRQRIANAVNQSYAEHLSDDDLSWDEDDETPPKKRRAKKTGVSLTMALSVSKDMVHCECCGNDEQLASSSSLLRADLVLVRIDAGSLYKAHT